MCQRQVSFGVVVARLTVIRMLLRELGHTAGCAADRVNNALESLGHAWRVGDGEEREKRESPSTARSPPH